MKNVLEISIVKNKFRIKTFWKLFYSYINELARNISLGDEINLDYFHSKQYKEAIEKLRKRRKNPLKIIFIYRNNIIIGFLMYVTYFNERGKCILMEYYIKPKYRNIGCGKTAFLMAEKFINDEGALYIELTPTNKANEKFWRSVGFKKSQNKDNDNKYYYRKYF